MHYVYIHRRNDTGEPFYIGKGSGRRAFVSRSRTAHWKRIVAKCGLKVDIVLTDLSEKDALDAEILLISMVGRADKGAGPLINYTDGGEGTSGRPMSEKARTAIALSSRNRPTSIAQKRIVGARYRGMTGAKHNRSTAVKCINTGVIYGSQTEAQRMLGLGSGSVGWSIKHNRPIYGLYFEAT